MSYLFDASSLFLLMRSSHEDQKLHIFDDAGVLELTYYEIGNTIWKESELLKLISKEEGTRLAALIVKSLIGLQFIKLAAADFAEILEMGKKERLSFYDSSYVYAAKTNGLILVSEDARLLRVAKKYAKTASAASLI